MKKFKEFITKKIDWKRYIHVTFLTTLMGTCLVMWEISKPSVILWAAFFNLIIAIISARLPKPNEKNEE